MKDNIKADLRVIILTHWKDICEFDYKPAGKLRLRMVELYLHFHILLHGVVLNCFSIATTVKSLCLTN
jgi:hypothetical protein